MSEEYYHILIIISLKLMSKFFIKAICLIVDNRVDNNRIYFEIPALLSCEWRNSVGNGAGNFKIYLLF